MSEKEIKGARISRGQLKTKANLGLESLQAMLRKLEDKEETQVSVTEMAALTSTMEEARVRLEK